MDPRDRRRRGPKPGLRAAAGSGLRGSCSSQELFGTERRGGLPTFFLWGGDPQRRKCKASRPHKTKASPRLSPLMPGQWDPERRPLPSNPSPFRRGGGGGGWTAPSTSRSLLLAGDTVEGPAGQLFPTKAEGPLKSVARPGSPWPGGGPRPGRLPGTPVPAGPLMASRGSALPGTTC